MVMPTWCQSIVCACSIASIASRSTCGERSITIGRLEPAGYANRPMPLASPMRSSQCRHSIVVQFAMSMRSERRSLVREVIERSFSRRASAAAFVEAAGLSSQYKIGLSPPFMWYLRTKRPGLFCLVNSLFMGFSVKQPQQNLVPGLSLRSETCCLYLHSGKWLLCPM